jgi:hypothetical protein
MKSGQSQITQYLSHVNVFYSKVWFNTPSQTAFARSAPAQIRQCLQKFGIKPDGIINFLSNEPPIKLTQRLRYRGTSPAEVHFFRPVPEGRNIKSKGKGNKRRFFLKAEINNAGEIFPGVLFCYWNPAQYKLCRGHTDRFFNSSLSGYPSEACGFHYW